MQVVEQPHQVLEVAVLTVDWFTLPIASKIIAENTEARRKTSEFMVPLTAISDAGMDHDERLAIARDFEVDPGVVDFGVAGLTGGLRHCTTP
jgi:hypothetical protein